MTVSKERWWTLPLSMQMGSIGSEVGRAAKWQGKNEGAFWGAVTRALELFELTQRDIRWKNRRREIDIAKEVFSDGVLGGGEYKTILYDLEKYFMQFALVANNTSK